LRGGTSVTVLQGKLETKTHQILVKVPFNKFVAETASTAQKNPELINLAVVFLYPTVSFVFAIYKLKFGVLVCERCVCVLLCEISIVLKVLVGCLCFQYM